MRFSTPSRINHGSDNWGQSNTIPHFLGRRNIVSSTTANGTKSYTVGPFEGTWRLSSRKAYSNSTSFLPKQPQDNQTLNFLENNIWSLSTRWLIDYPSPQHTGHTPFHSNSMYFIFWIKYYSMFLTITVHSSIIVHLIIAVHPSMAVHRSTRPAWWDFPYSEVATWLLRW